MKMRRGFTLIELLCALAVAGVLITVVGNLTVNALYWGHVGFEAQVIGEQFEQALDLIEEDVRNAVDIDVSEWGTEAPLSEMKVTSELRLWVVDATTPHLRGRVFYSLGRSGNAIAEDMPLERPYPNMNLLRAQKDRAHQGQKQPVVYYLNSAYDTPKGLQVHYYNRFAEPCTLAEDIYSVCVILSGCTKDGSVITRQRQIPLTIKYE